MAVNRYDRAAEAPIINTYVPIDFNQLYRIGVTQKQAVDEAAKELNQAIQTFGEFYSPSQVDTQNYYKASIGQFDDLITEMVRDPNRMKDPAFRSSLQARLNGIDYGYLSSLKQSRDNMLARQAANQKLMLDGGYNPILHDIDFNNYDTRAAGIFQETSVLPYTSVVDMVKPYVDNLKDEFMGVSGGWIHTGVSNERTDAQVSDNWSNIINTPAYSQNLELIMRQVPGISIEDAQAMLQSQIYRAGREFARHQQERDPFAMRMALMQAKAAKEEESKRLNNLTTLLQTDAAYNNLINFTSLTPDKIQAFMIHGNSALTEDELKQLQYDMTPEHKQYVLRDRFRDIVNNTGDIQSGLDGIAQMMSRPISSSAAEIYAKDGTTGKKDQYGRYTAHNTRDFQLTRNIALDLIGSDKETGRGFDVWDSNGIWVDQLIHPDWNSDIDANNERSIARETQIITSEIWNRFSKDWENGNVTPSFKVAPGQSQLVGLNNQYINKWAYVPVDELLNKGYTEEEIALIAPIINEDGSVSKTTRTDYRGNIDSISTTEKSGKKYAVIGISSVLPTQGEAAIAADAQWTKLRSIGSQMNTTQNFFSEEENY